MTFFTLFGGILLQIVGTLLVIAGTSSLLLTFWKKRKKSVFLFLGISAFMIGMLGIILSGRSFLGWYLLKPQPKLFGAYSHGAFPQTSTMLAFAKNIESFEKVADIAKNPTDLPPSLHRRENTVVKFTLEAKEVLAETAPGVVVNYWTYNGTVPGPFLRVVEGDTVEITLKNHPTSLHTHSIDLHAVNGPGGGATLTQVAPGEQKTFQFKALNAGIYVYHCASTDPATHMTHGQYGLILVEPKGGLPSVDKEFYIMQGEIYTYGNLGDKGLQLFNGEAMLNGEPQYIVFNGRVGGVNGKMKAKTGEQVRIFVGNGGVSLTSSFHVIGEIFDRVYPEGAIATNSSILSNVQTTNVPAGGATVVEFDVDVPGKYILVDHALARVNRGAIGTLEAEGQPTQPDVFSPVSK